MWPDLFGPGWVWGVFLSFGLLGVFAGLLKCLDLLCKEPEGTEDPLEELWHRYEIGDLTRQEFERLKPARATYMPPDLGRGRGRYAAGLSSWKLATLRTRRISSESGENV